jgi:predicted DNA-binding transcriptional regulator AlpA
MAHWKEFLSPSGETGRFLRWKEVAHATGLSRTTAWRLQKRDEFPAPYAISPGRVGYREAEIDAWRASRALSGAASASVPTVSTARDAVIRRSTAPQPRAASPPPAPLPTPVKARRPRRRSEHARAIAQQIMLDF